MKQKQLIIWLAVGFAAGFGLASLRGLFTAESAQAAFMALSDGFFVAGVLLVSAGLLFFVKNQGLFDALAFSARNVFRLRWPALGSFREEFAQYRDRSKAKSRPFAGLLISGGAYIALGLVFLGGYFIVFSVKN